MADAPLLYVILSAASRDWPTPLALTAAASDGLGTKAHWGTMDCRVGVAPAGYGDNQLWRRSGKDGRFWLEAVALSHPGGGVGGGLNFSAVQGRAPVRVVMFDENDRGFYWNLDTNLEVTPIVASPGDQLLEISGNGPYDARSPVRVYEYDRHNRAHQEWRFAPYRPSFGHPRIVYRQRSLAAGGGLRGVVHNLDNRGSRGPRVFNIELTASGVSQHRWRAAAGSQSALERLAALGGSIGLDEVASFRPERLQAGSGLEPKWVAAPSGLVLGADTSAAVTVRGQLSLEVEVPGDTRLEVSLEALSATFKADWRAAIDRLTPERATAATYDIEGGYEVSGVYDFALRVEEPLVGGRSRPVRGLSDRETVTLSRG
ncbi:hypothetical protein [Caulobacter endophyticus]|uniref:hypothetical protein n=1 Tax=Caulobacter endophyticus TaxID=2172652 RepID=UPI00240FE6AF|nr:hypothetical protein [Caulobacter endophyticus]MDG2531662.1 hypothetical protein [Caulobacter endophyticus]